MWGKNTSGECGQGHLDHIALPCRVSYFVNKRKRVSSISCGSSHTVAITDDGYVLECSRMTSRCVYQWGNLINENDCCMLPVKKVMPVNITRPIECAAGEGYSMVLTETGQVVFWGTQIGHSDVEPAPRVMKAFAGMRIVTITAGHAHAAAVSDDGIMYTWGTNTYGQLGHGDARSTYSPKPVTMLSHAIVSSICCGEYNTVCDV